MQYRRPPTRRIDGILLLDKPQGLTSNAALQKVRTLFSAEKAGHTGALDPLATGLLPVCLGEATKIAGLLLAERKAYETTVKLGVVTDSDDAEGVVLRTRDVPEIQQERLDAVLQRFVGNIMQVPPIYSALKRGGEPLYVKARRGEDIDVEARPVEVFGIELLGRGADWLRLKVECGSGTYIRSLARDIGEALGCGGHVETLRRLWVDPFREPIMRTLEQIAQIASQGNEALDALLLPIETGLVGYPSLTLDEDTARRLGQGQQPQSPNPSARGLQVVTDTRGRALGLVEVEDSGRMNARRLFRWAAVT
jgi:tRNA pseudouridine55 synthase